MVEEADMATEVAKRTGKSEDTGEAEIVKKDENGVNAMEEDVKEDGKTDTKEGEENKEEHIDSKKEEEKFCLKEEEENKVGEENDSKEEENKMEIDNDSKEVEENKVEIASTSKDAEVNKVLKNKDKKEEEETAVEENKDTKAEEGNKAEDNKHSVEHEENKDSKEEVGDQDSKEVVTKNLKEEKEKKDSKKKEKSNSLKGKEEKKDLKKKEENGIEEHIDDKEEEEREKEDPRDSKDSEENEETINEEKTSEALKNCSYKGGAKEEAKEPTSPVASHMDRPVRERKSVERLVASIEKEPAREFLIPKGRGTALKDIPSVANKLSRKKNEEILKMLHVILFGRRGKATHVRSNLSQFSGFVWHENEEKQRLKIKEKLDKLVKEKLMEFCDVFDIPLLKATAKKEDIVTRLLDFLAAPKPVGNAAVAEKEELGTTKKRSKIVKRSTPESGGSDAKHLSKKKRKIEGTSKMEENESDSGHEFDKSETDGEFDNEEDEERARSFSDGSEDEVAEHSQRKEKQSESKEESEEETRNQNLNLKKSSMKPSSGKNKHKKVANAKKENPALSPKKYSTKKRSRDQVEKNKDEGIGRSGPDESEDEAGEDSISKENGSDSSEESEEETRKENSVSKRPSSKMISPVEARPKKKNSTTNETPVHSPTKSPSTKRLKVNDSSSKSIEVFSRKKKNQETDKANSPAPMKSTKEDVREQSGKKSSKGKDERTKEKPAPTESEIRKMICQILVEVDLKKATFLDILKQLGDHFKVDLEPRKAEIKLMVKEELTKLNDEEDDEEDDESETEDEKTPKPKVQKTKPSSADRGKSVETDSESRCRRSDGKKWRCSKAVVDGQKYCEHHMNRGKKR